MPGKPKRWLYVAFALLALAGGLLLRTVLIREPKPIEARFIADASSLPQSLRSLRARMQGKTSEEVLALIEKTFGPPVRNVGSGLSIPQWDFDGGVLTFHPLCGPTFAPKSGGRIWLINTHNRLGSNLLSGYEMATKPDRSGMRYWIGNIEINRDGTYAFFDAEVPTDHKARRRKCFFTEHRHGNVSVTYPPGFGANTLLESTKEKGLVATLHFTSVGDKQAYDIINDPVDRMLSLVSTDFEMDRGWENYWR